MVGSNLALALLNSRMQDSEANTPGLIFMSMAVGSYNHEEAILFRQRMAALNKNKTPEILSTYPGNETRIKNLSVLRTEIKTTYYRSK